MAISRLVVTMDAVWGSRQLPAVETTMGHCNWCIHFYSSGVITLSCKQFPCVEIAMIFRGYVATVREEMRMFKVMSGQNVVLQRCPVMFEKGKANSITALVLTCVL